MRNRNTVAFLVVWEELHNPDFYRVQFEAVRTGYILSYNVEKMKKSNFEERIKAYYIKLVA